MSVTQLRRKAKRLRKRIDALAAKKAELRQEPARVFVLLPDTPVPEDFNEANGDRIVSIEILGQDIRDFGGIWAVTRIRYQRPQFEAMFCEEDEGAYVGGLGSGKSWALVRFGLCRMVWEPQSLHMTTMATLEHARDSVIPEFERALGDFGFVEGEDFWWRRKDSGGRPNLYLKVGRQVVVMRFRASDNHESLRGPEVATLLIDEMRGCDPEGVKVAYDRVRCTKAKTLAKRGSTTPNGWDATYERFVEDFSDVDRYEVRVRGRDVPVSVYTKRIEVEEPDDDGNMETLVFRRRLVNTSTDANAFVKKGYGAEISTDTDARRVRQERGGEFLAPATVVAHQFDRMLDVKSVDYDPDLDVYIGQDFNIARNLSVLAHLVEDDQGRLRLRVFAEIKAKDTQETAQRINALLKNHRARRVLVPDPAGANRDTRSRRTDHDILRKECGLEVKRFRAPSVFDSANLLNERFCDGSGYDPASNEQEPGFRAIDIDSDCVELVKDCGQVEWDKSGERIKKATSGPGLERTHALDGLRYLTWVLMPKAIQNDRGGRDRVRG